MLALAPAGSALAQAQDDIDEPVPPARTGQAARAASAELNAALVRLGRDPRNAAALVDAGQAALHMGDTQAALGFFTRADQVSPNNARIKMQIGSALVTADEPTEAVKYFDAAESANGDLTSFALDRGLAYDLLGDNRQAQGWYQVALSRGPSEEATLRYAISLAITHDLKTAETLLSPLIQKQDRAGWRARTFALAINGDDTQAIAISRAMMPAPLAEGITPYLRYMPRLTRSQQAAAANLGRFPRAADIGHDDSRIMAYAAAHPEIGRGLVPVGTPLGAQAGADDARTSRAKRRRPGQGEADASRGATVRTAPLTASAIDGDLVAAPRPPAKRGKPAKSALAMAQTTPAAAPVAQRPAYTPAPTIPVPAVRSVLDGPPLPRTATQRIALAPVSRPVAVAAVKLAPTLPVSVKTVPATVVKADPLPPPPNRAQLAVAAGPKPLPLLTASPGPSATLHPSATAAATVAPTTAAPLASPAASAPASAAGGGTAFTPRPAVGSTFDLARLDASRVSMGTPTPTPAPAPATPTAAAPIAAAPSVTLVPSASPASAQPASSSTGTAPAPAADFGAAFGSFTAPPTERETTVAAVNLSKIKPIRRRPDRAAEVAAVVEEPVPTTLKGKAALKARLRARGERPDGPVASRSGDDDEDSVTVTRGATLGPKARKAALAAEAEAKKAGAKGKAGKRGAPANPSRIWVQLLTAPNRDAFAREWARIAKQAPSILRGKRGWVTPWGHNYRLLMGPYASDDDAQDALNDLTKAKVRGFVWTSPAGQAIDHLGDEG